MNTHLKLAKLLLCSGLVLGLASQPCFAEHVVVETNAADYTAGQILAFEATISLAAGEFLVAISEDGTAFRIDGPYEGQAENENRIEVDIADAFARIIGAPQAELGTLGGVRGGSTPDAGVIDADTRPSPWLVHVGQTGDQCILRGQTAEVWREDSDSGSVLEITEVASGLNATVRWQGNSQRAAWPAQLLPREQAVYLVRPVERLRSTAIRLHEVEASIADAELATLAWLAAKGCIAQARLLLAAR